MPDIERPSITRSRLPLRVVRTSTGESPVLSAPALVAVDAAYLDALEKVAEIATIVVGYIPEHYADARSFRMMLESALDELPHE